jgi:hypothetical protein
LVIETHAVFLAMADGMSQREVKEKCLSGGLLRKSARFIRMRIGDAMIGGSFHGDHQDGLSLTLSGPRWNL